MSNSRGVGAGENMMHNYIFGIHISVTAVLPPPAFESTWLTMLSKSINQYKLTLQHGLGEIPLLVDVEVKSLDTPNEGFIFPAVGE